MRDFRFERADGRVVQMESIERNGRLLLTLRLCQADGSSREGVCEWGHYDAEDARSAFLTRASEPVILDDSLKQESLDMAVRFGRPAAVEVAMLGGRARRLAGLLHSFSDRLALNGEVCRAAALVRRVRLAAQTAVRALPVELAVELDTWLDEATGVL